MFCTLYNLSWLLGSKNPFSRILNDVSSEKRCPTSVTISEFCCAQNVKCAFGPKWLTALVIMLVTAPHDPDALLSHPLRIGCKSVPGLLQHFVRYSYLLAILLAGNHIHLWAPPYHHSGFEILSELTIQSTTNALWEESSPITVPFYLPGAR